jgi:hypothetical protein
MSSVSSSFANNTRLPYPTQLIALTYGSSQVVPFTYNNSTRVLDFDFSGDFTESTTINSATTIYVQGSSFGAASLVNDIGPNIVAWCESQANADVGTVRILEKPIVVRANQIAEGREPNSDQAMRESNTPFEFENASGTAANRYNTTYIFRKPLVVTYTVSGVTKYRMFNTQYGGQT